MDLLVSAIVVTGEGFTPQLLGAQTLHEVFAVEPTQIVTSPPIAVLDYPDGYQVVVQEQRFNVSRKGSLASPDERLQVAARKLLSLWPLVNPKAIGINFDFGDVFGAQLSQDDVVRRLAPRERIEAVFGGKALIGSKHSFIFMSDETRITIQVTTDSVIAERPGFTLTFNAHHTAASNAERLDVEAVVNSQAQWHNRAVEWGEALVYGE